MNAPPSSSMVPESLRGMLPEGLEEAMNDAFNSGEGQQDPASGKGKGKCKGNGDQFMRLGDLKGKGKGLEKGESKGKGKGKSNLGSYDSFATNAPMCGSFATRAPDRMSFQTDVLGTRSSFAQLRSDESFAAGLPASAARAGQAAGLPPACMSFVAGPSNGINTRPSTDSFSTQAPGQSSIFIPAGNTEPPQQGLSTRAPHCGSFNVVANPVSMSRRSRGGPGLEPINEFACQGSI